MLHKGIRGLGFALLLAGCAVATAQDRVVAPLPSLSALVERVAPSVVNISVTEIVDDTESPFGDRDLPPFLEEFRDNLRGDLPPEREGAGSGVIVDAELGYVLTNHHVIETADEIHVTLTDNRSFDATVIGSDPESDVAVLQIEADGLTAIHLAETADLKVGDYVVAIGNPFGLGQTVTSGIVSALGRAYSGSNNNYEDFIQTDASINVGNSGGALINLDGDLVGINSAIISRTGDSVGIGFAIPTEMVVSVMDRLLQFGRVPRGLLGVYMETVTPAFAEDYGLEVTAGALVTQVSAGSAAEAAGLRINDVITGLNGEPIADSNQLRNRVAMRLPGEEVSIAFVRNGRARSTDAILDARDPSQSSLPAQRDSRVRPNVFEGIDLSPESGADGGLRILAVTAGATPQARIRLRDGDLIRAVNQQRVRSVAEARELAEGKDNVVVEIEREVFTQNALGENELQSIPQLVRLR